MGVAFVGWRGALPQGFAPGAIRLAAAQEVAALAVDCSVLVVGPVAVPEEVLDEFGGQVLAVSEAGLARLPTLAEPGPAVRAVRREFLRSEIDYWEDAVPLQRLPVAHWLPARYGLGRSGGREVGRSGGG